MDTQIHDIDWKQLQQLETQLFATGKLHQVRVKKETVPIIFVPGIMGTRLRGENGVVWDPSDPSWMKDNYSKATPAQRKKALIDDKSVDVLRFGQIASLDQQFISKTRDQIFAAPALYFDWLPHPTFGYNYAEQKQEWSLFAAQEVAKQGWAEIASVSYVDFLIQLSQPGALFPYLRYFYCPVYAFGYNWIKDNAIAGDLLVKRIEEIIRLENGKPKRYCKKVLVVTHSMGGIVARSALLSGAKCLVRGIVHGAQPVTGAPVAYRRMRAGFENIHPYGANPYADLINHYATLTLGPSAEHVVPILGNAVGGLELLPTQFYVDNNKDAKWLGELTKDGKPISDFLPKQSDPYNEIYKLKKSFLRLITDGKQLAPGGAPASGPTSNVKTPEGTSSEDPFGSFFTNIDAAKAFHKTLGLEQHDADRTYVMYSSGLESYHQVRYRYLRDRNATEVISMGPYTPGKVIPLGDEPIGTGTDYDPDFHKEGGGSFLKIDDPSSKSGDGTVPKSSATILKAAGTFAAPPVGHQDFYKNEQVHVATFTFLMKVLEDYVREETGK